MNTAAKRQPRNKMIRRLYFMVRSSRLDQIVPLLLHLSVCKGGGYGDFMNRKKCKRVTGFLKRINYKRLV